jgi:uncharacterized membrane protein
MVFAKFGELIIKLFSLVGMVILAIPKIPGMIRNINTNKIRQKIDTDNVKGNLSRIKDGVDSARETYSSQKTVSTNSRSEESRKTSTNDLSKKNFVDSDVISVGKYTSEEKESTVFQLQIASAAFIVFSILYVFNFISLIIFIIVGGLTIAFVIYMLINKVREMYPQDFNAYRDFFLMYLAVGIIVILVSWNSSLVMAFSFQALPSLSILIYAIIAVVAVFLIFRMRYHRNFTFGTVLDAGQNTAHVKVEYDIRSNVKPDIYLVENDKGAVESDRVKLKIEDKLFSSSGNRPTKIIEIYKK